MPVVKLSVKRLLDLIGDKSVDEQKLEELLFNLKCEATPLEDGRIEVEVNSDRPDLLISEGVARAVKGLLGVEKGLPHLSVYDTSITLEVHDVPSRPYIGLGVLENYPLDEETLEELIQFQEKLHTTIGRKRRKVAIGIHDLDKLPSKKIVYKEVDIREATMKPLHREGEWKVIDVLEKTEQGREYGRISLRNDFMHPAIYAGDEIISLPPVLNSDVTRLEPGTRNLLIDVTGTDREAVLKTLDILLSTLAERRGARIGRVVVSSPYHEGFMPLLSRESMRVSCDYVCQQLGFKLDCNEIASLLEKMRFGVSTDGRELCIVVPEYRIDILHPIDIVEDVAIAYGYSNISVLKPREIMKPSPHELPRVCWRASEIMVGLGFTELMTYILVPERLATKILLPSRSLVRLRNPVSLEMNVVRPSLIVSLLLALRESQGVELPLKIFEIGETACMVGGRVISNVALGLAVMDDSVSFEDVQAPLFALLEYLGLTPSTKRAEFSFMIRGRAAYVEANGSRVGVVGEIHPSLLEELDIKYPVAVAEVNLEALLRLTRESIGKS